MPNLTDITAEAARLRNAFEATGAAVIEAAILQPADTLLDLYGEDIRARAYVTSDPLRGEQMLRPDFTVPVVQLHMAGQVDPARYTYSGKVFRKQEHDPHRPSEYVQVGLEIFDGSDPEAADADVFATFAQLLRPYDVKPVTGDIGILTAAINGLSTSPERRAALMRHVWRPRRFRALLDRFAGTAPQPTARTALLKRLAAGKDPLRGVGPQIGLRSAAEVQTRLDLLQADAALPPLPSSEVDLLGQLMTLKERAPAALEHLRDIAVDLPAILGAVQRLDRRLAALRARDIDVDSLDFEAAYGRTTMEYYDGFVFGFSAPGRRDLPPVATGGRYDALTRVLGKGRTIPAVGGVIRPEVLLAVAQNADLNEVGS
ncbi:ATP phosphoribosyltransferase regulatory subunit [Pseudoruegeria sp. SK021]|uniref:ATP phosphoribosyltransferase regulatory subunit n=1 Tax=Pseudoruegeria sp. SK021 TaxID=1933035 RepID=UPI000A264341|nr:ATP phosphoribosyltransferase regulatory subunit [Pseudoruegeria sp. SK021]OSP53515.1 ATP phosphoribosyltransferase regulatory subunit [Pseudoruegeria sp. SK021]